MYLKKKCGIYCGFHMLDYINYFGIKMHFKKNHKIIHTNSFYRVS